MSESPAEDKPSDKRGAPMFTAAVAFGAIVVAGLLLVMVLAYLSLLIRAPGFPRVREAHGFFAVFANVAVTFYAFPAFMRTKNRAFLAIAFASLGFAYGSLFNLLAGRSIVAAFHVSAAQAQWYYAAQHAAGIVGLILYAYGFISLAKKATLKA